jgi:acetolactate synthase I/II/III large subunit
VSNRRTLRSAIAEVAVAEGVTVAFASAGGNVASTLGAELSSVGIRVVTASTDHGAVAMADGYARTSGQPGICLLWRPFGESTGATALATAVRRGSQVMVVADGSSNTRRAHMVGAVRAPLRSTQTRALAEDLREAFRTVRRGSPTIVDADDGLGVTVEGRLAYARSTTGQPRLQRVGPDAGQLTRAVEMLAAARAPIVLVGRGAREAGAEKEIAAIAERLGAPIATTLQAKGLHANHPHLIGLAGGFGTPRGEELFAQADCVLVFGAGLNVYTTKKGRLFAGASVIQIDIGRPRLGYALPVDLALVGDARSTAVALLVELERNLTARHVWFEREERTEERPMSEIGSSDTPQIASDGLDPRVVVDVLDRLLPPRRTVVLDGGHFRSFVIDGVNVTSSDAFIDCVDFGAISVALPLAIGAALGAPERRTVACVGDGGFAMTMSELWTVLREQVPVTIVVFNDDAYGGELRQLEIKGSPVHGVLFANPDFARFANALGVPAERVESAEALERALETPQAPDDPPLFLDVAVTQSVRFRYHPILEELAFERARASTRD